MSDILFHYLKYARRREQSWARHLFTGPQNLLSAGLEQLVETAAVQIDLYSQHEEKSMETVVTSLASEKMVNFYDEPTPRRPKADRLVNRTEGFPLRNTRRTTTCARCRGTKGTTCYNCRGTRNESCHKCKEKGTVVRWAREVKCSHCQGNGRTTCFLCRGEGQLRCETCEGEGQTVQWDVEIYRWYSEHRNHVEIPGEAPPALHAAFLSWLETEIDRVPDLDSTTTAAHLGHLTPEIQDVVENAQAQWAKMEEEAHGSQDTCLFQVTDLSLTAVGHTVVRNRTQAHSLWMVGHGAQAVVLEPPSGFSIAKLPSALATRLGRLLRSTTDVQVIAVLSGDDQPSPWFSCVAHLGSYTGRLQVLDRNYTRQLAQLRQTPESLRDSQSLSVVLRDGRHLRLVEVVDATKLPEPRFHLIAETVDGVLLLHPPDRPLKDLETRLHALRPSPPRVASLHLDNDPDLPLLGAGPLPVEAMRRAFVDKPPAEVDWTSIFDRLWEPVEALQRTPRWRHRV